MEGEANYCCREIINNDGIVKTSIYCVVALFPSVFLHSHLSVCDGLFSNLEIVFCVFSGRKQFREGTYPVYRGYVNRQSAVTLQDRLIVLIKYKR